MEASSSPPPGIYYNYPSPSSPSSSSPNFPILAIAIIGILATAFLLVSYYIFVIKCCLNWHRMDILNRFNLNSSQPIHNNQSSSSPSLSSSSPNKGLDEALIRLIPVIRFRKEHGNGSSTRDGDETKMEMGEKNEYMECAVCLSEFSEGEKLRVIPNCCHGFHIDCIDVWLQSNANCPLCRCGISSNSLSSIDRLIGKFATNESSRRRMSGIHELGIGSVDETTNNDDDDDDDYVVIEIQDNNLDEPRLVSKRVIDHQIQDNNLDYDESRLFSRGDMNRRMGLKVMKSMDDECVDVIKKQRVKDDGSGVVVQPFRRSISLDLTSQRKLWSEVRETIAERKEVGKDIDHQCCTTSSGGGGGGSGRGVRRSFFSFGSSKSTVLPL